MSKLHKSLALAWIFLSTLIPAFAASPLSGRFYLSQEKYSAGEPIFLTFKLKNNGAQPIEFMNGSPYAFCGGFQIEVQGIRNREPLPCGVTGSGGSCVAGEETLLPGKTFTTRILLNHLYDLRQPGRFSLHVTRSINYVAVDDHAPVMEHLLPARSGTREDFETRLEIVVQPSQPAALAPKFQQYKRDLQAGDSDQQLQAAEVIAYLAPPFMEKTILRMLKSPQFQAYGLIGLRNLGTPTAHRALANFVKNPLPYQNPAIGYLGEIGDKSDIATLLNAVHANDEESGNREIALQAIGEAGGGNAVPVLVAQLNDPDIDSRQAAIRGLYSTGSRLAVPVLIGLLLSPQWRESLTAEYGLEVLTHRRGATTNTMNPPPSDTYLKWTRWWSAHGGTATIYKPDQCGEILPLPSP